VLEAQSSAAWEGQGSAALEAQGSARRASGVLTHQRVTRLTVLT